MLRYGVFEETVPRINPIFIAVQYTVKTVNTSILSYVDLV
jgi:hypothetical protein